MKEESNILKEGNKGAPKRDYYLDWARTSDVHIVVLIHCIMSTDMVTK